MLKDSKKIVNFLTRIVNKMLASPAYQPQTDSKRLEAMKCYNLIITSQRFTYEIMYNDASIYEKILRSMLKMDLLVPVEKQVYCAILTSLINLARNLKYRKIMMD